MENENNNQIDLEEIEPPKKKVNDFGRGDIEIIKQVQECMRTLERRGYKPNFTINGKRIP